MAETSSPETFPAPGMELTHILVVADVDQARAWYVDVLGAELYREYGGSSPVLTFAPTATCSRSARRA